MKCKFCGSDIFVIDKSKERVKFSKGDIETLSVALNGHKNQKEKLYIFCAECGEEINVQIEDKTIEAKKETNFSEKANNIKQYSEKYKILEILENNLKKDVKEWEREIAQIDIQKQKKINEYKKKQGNKLNSKIFKINQEQEKELQEINNEIQQLENENNKKINEFNSLNFLKLIQKDKLKTEINNNKQRIESLKIKADNIKEENNVKIQILEQKFKEDIAEEECKADLECIYPLNPEELIFSLYSPMGKNRIENAQILQEIYSTMYYDNEEFTIDMLASELDIPSQKIYLMLNYLKRQNLVERTSYTTTTSYFQIKYSDDELDKGINTKFSKDRRFLYAYMNRVKKKSISEIFKEIETISFIRIAQALESLVEQYILGKKVEDDEVYYFILIDM